MADILVVDDESVWRELCGEKLRQMGHRAIPCADCVEALEKIKSEAPDLVVLDLRMPVSGRSMLRALRQDWPRMPVVIHTVYSAYRDDPDLAARAHFALKSPGLEELVSKIRELVGGEKEAAPAGRDPD
jgi:CheY-like chemotaxis protein